MANDDIIRSYLVSLGFVVDRPQLANFNNVLRDVAASVERETGTIAGAFVKTGSVVVGALASIAGATIGLMDHVATADLGFQLYAMRMYMSTDAAKKLKLATDALGYSLEEIAWNPELRGRYRELVGMQDIMQAALGPDFEEQMRKIRDLRFEFTKFWVESQYVAMGVVKSLSKALFGDEDALLTKLRSWNEWLTNHIPEVSDKIASYLKPILEDVKAVIHDLWDITIKFVGALFDDEKLKTGEVNIDNVGRALDHVSHAIRETFDWLDKIANLAAQHRVIANLLGGTAAGAVAGSVIPGIGTAVGAAYGAAAGTLKGLFPADTPERQRAILQQAIREVAERQGIPTSIALAVAQKESGFDPYAIGKASVAKGGPEIGLFQLMKPTAEALGINREDIGQNIVGGITLLRNLYNKYGNWTQALEAYNAGEGAVDRGRVPPMSQTYAADVLRGAQGFGYQGSITIGDIHVHAETQDPVEHGRKVAEVVKQEIDKRTQQNLAEFGGVYSMTNAMAGITP